MSKRTAASLSSSTTQAKKAKRAPSPSPSAGSGSAEEFDDFEDLEDDEQDSEVDEFAQGNNDEDDEDLIGDDGEDLMAGLDDEEVESEDAPSFGDDHSADDDEDDDDESEEDLGDSDLTAAQTPAPITKPKGRNSKGPKPLTPAEIRALAFAELTASPISNTIASSVTNFLSTITPPPPATSPLQPLLKAVHAHIVSLSSRKGSSLDGLRKRGLVVPPVEGGKAGSRWAGLDFDFEKPKSDEVRVVGKWAWGGGVKVGGEYNVELAVAMPQSLIRPKDHLSPRFLISSTHYLVTLASQLPTALLGPVTLSYARLPASQGYALEIRSAHTKGDDKVGLAKIKGAVLRIRIAWPAEAIALSKLSPLSNTARPDTHGENLQLKPNELPSTPLHSTSLLLSSLATRTAHLTSLHALASAHPSFPASVRLMQIWAARRGFSESLGLTDEWWAWCVARTLGWGASMEAKSGEVGGDAWAGWRKAVEWLAGANWTDGIWFRTEGEKAFDRDEFRTAYKGEALLVDPTGTVNLAAGIPLATLEMLKQDAKTTIALLLTTATDDQKFAVAFERELPAAERFDNFARITIPKAVVSDALKDREAALDYSDSIEFLHASISATLRRAFGNRAKAFQLIAPPSPGIPVSGPAPSAKGPVVFTLGVLADGVESIRLVDHGPSADEAEACADFSRFWGSKSELRRFQDGQIRESVVWNAQFAGMGQRRHTVLSQIVKHILPHRHLIPLEAVEVFAGAMDHLIVEPEVVRKAIFLEDSVATNKNFGNLLGAYDALSKELRDLKELPLGIQSVTPSTPGLRYSTTFIPSPRRLKNFGSQADASKFIDAHEMLLTLEGSGRWPDDLEGVQKIKAAFLVKIAEQLNALHTVYQAQVVFDLEARPIDDNVAVEILTNSGYAFVARIFYDRTTILLDQRAEKRLAMGAPEVSAAGVATSLELYNRRFVAGPKQHLALHTLQHHFPSYSHTVRLTKRWFSAHMLLPHFPSELIELVVASVFVDPATAFEAPQSGATGLARVMSRLASWDFKGEPLLVTLHSFAQQTTSGRRPVFPSDKADKARKAFEIRRVADPGVNEFAWVVATEEDVFGVQWGRTDKVVCGRARGLARATLKALNEGVRDGGLVIESLFTAPLEDYNFLIHLDPSVVPRHFQALAPQPKALSRRQPVLSSGSAVLAGAGFSFADEDEEDDTPRIGLDPVADLVTNLNKLYPGVFLLFWAPDGGAVIGGIWHPSVLGAKSWKVGMGWPVVVVGGEGEGKKKVELDVRGVMREVERVGKGLVMRTEVL